MRTLILPVKQIYFEQIQTGQKDEEYRAISPHWQKRLENKEYDQVIITLGYPATGDSTKRLVFPFRGITPKKIQHEEFGPTPCEVYAIKLGNQQLGFF